MGGDKWTLEWREKKCCQGLCQDANHLRYNTIHTHRWLPKPPSSLYFRRKSYMLDQEFSDPATVRHNEDWASLMARNSFWMKGSPGTRRSGARDVISTEM